MMAAVALSSCQNQNTATTATRDTKVVGKSTKTTGGKRLTAEMIAQGKTTFENNCNKCHALPDPKSHTDAQWVGLVNVMAPKAKLTDHQAEMVYDYVTFANN